MLSNHVFRILRLFMHLLCTILSHDISNNRSTPFCFMHIIWDLPSWISVSNMFALMFLTLYFVYFLHCFSYISLAQMDAHFSINKVLPPTWLRRIKNRNSYQSLLQLLTKRASQTLSYL